MVGYLFAEEYTFLSDHQMATFIKISTSQHETLSLDPCRPSVMASDYRDHKKKQTTADRLW